jgi:hypothetical protein
VTSFVPTAAELADVLEPNEKVLWAGKPDPVATFRTQLMMWWVGVPITAVALVVNFKGWLGGFGFFPLVIGGALMAAPFLMIAHAYGTIYALTDRRAIIKHDALGRRRVESWPLGALDDTFEVLESSAGCGHVYFGTQTHKNQRLDADYTGKIAFREVRRPHEVAKLLERLRAAN